jgi:hypothetical protein
MPKSKRSTDNNSNRHSQSQLFFQRRKDAQPINSGVDEAAQKINEEEKSGLKVEDLFIASKELTTQVISEGTNNNLENSDQSVVVKLKGSSPIMLREEEDGLLRIDESDII